MDLQYRYLKPGMFGLSERIKVIVEKDYGKQDFEGKQLYQLVIKILSSDDPKTKFHQNQLYQLVISYKQRINIAKIKELGNLEGTIFQIDIATFSTNRYVRKLTCDLIFHFVHVELPKSPRLQTRLLNVVDCKTKPGAR